MQKIDIYISNQMNSFIKKILPIIKLKKCCFVWEKFRNIVL